MPHALSRFAGRALATAVLAAVVGAAAAASADAPMAGFSAAGATAQRSLEARFDAQLNPADLRAWMQTLSAEPNQVGSPHDKANAEYVLQQFRDWGWDAHIETFDVLYPTPKSEALELVAPNHFTASLKEPPVEGDASSARTASALPPYLIYGGDGDVTAELVYVNYGMPDDYKELARHGIDVKGKIVIARYGAGWRGLKPKLAYEHGAVGCIIYSDPHDDGYGPGDTYPKGGWRPPEGVQRGSVADMPIASGDPLTPDVGATKNAKRLALKDAKTILKIPTLPISYADAQPLLAALGGDTVPANWRGALPITYHYGPGPAKVHLAVQSDWGRKTLYDVIATIKGSQYPDQWVMRGNHRDGWVFGAWDPISGHVAMMAEAKAIGTLAKSGWKPKRTLVYASWDGEEAGLLGSTEWAETHAAELKRKGVLYVNSDTNVRGFLEMGGSHSLQGVMNQIAADVPDPETGVSVLERRRAKIEVDGYAKGAGAEQKELAKRVADGELPLDALGSGSDFTPFLQHLGIASLNLDFDGEDDQAGVYHSTYDTFEHYVRFGDPDFAYGVALAKLAGRTMLRVADADVLPLRFGDVADTYGRYVDELHKLADGERERSVTLDRLLDAHAFKLAADPKRASAPPPREDAVPYLNLAPLDNAMVRLRASSKAFDAAYAEAAKQDLVLADAQRSRVDGILHGIEQTLIDPQGLPGRPWYKHMIYAPGLHTGYGVKTMPGVREAIEERHWDDANRYAVVIAKALDDYSAQLDKATAALGGR